MSLLTLCRGREPQDREKRLRTSRIPLVSPNLLSLTTSKSCVHETSISRFLLLKPLPRIFTYLPTTIQWSTSPPSPCRPVPVHPEVPGPSQDEEFNAPPVYQSKIRKRHLTCIYNIYTFYVLYKVCLSSFPILNRLLDVHFISPTFTPKSLWTNNSFENRRTCLHPGSETQYP